MKKQYGESINNMENIERKTEVAEDIEEEIVDELQDEIFDKLKDALVGEARLVKRFYDFCLEHNSFEFDEMGMNMEEAEEVLDRANKIRDKLLANIENLTLYKFSSVKTDEVYCKILFDIIVEEESRHCIIEADNDSFDLEVY